MIANKLIKCHGSSRRKGGGAITGNQLQELFGQACIDEHN